MNCLVKMKIYLLLPSRSNEWVFGKIATKLVNGLKARDIRVELVDKIGGDLVGSNNVVHHLSFVSAYNVPNAVNTCMVTHLDDKTKIAFVAQLLNDGHDMAISMSSETSRILSCESKLPDNVCYVPPANDPNMPIKKIIIGITTRLYSDGRKRESMLIDLAKYCDLKFFQFRIIGKGWDDVVIKLRSMGVDVIYYSARSERDLSYDQIRKVVSRCEYYMYLGQDEGSLGTLDALAAGVKTIITPQGFHLDLKNGITHSISGLQSLINTFNNIRIEKAAIMDSVARLTWELYVERHIAVWQACIAKETANLQDRILRIGDQETCANMVNSTLTCDILDTESRRINMRRRILGYGRILRRWMKEN
jgi:hypothetical protein